MPEIVLPPSPEIDVSLNSGETGTNLLISGESIEEYFDRQLKEDQRKIEEELKNEFEKPEPSAVSDEERIQKEDISFLEGIDASQKIKVEHKGVDGSFIYDKNKLDPNLSPEAKAKLEKMESELAGKGYSVSDTFRSLNGDGKIYRTVYRVGTDGQITYKNYAITLLNRGGKKKDGDPALNEDQESKSEKTPEDDSENEKENEQNEPWSIFADIREAFSVKLTEDEKTGDQVKSDDKVLAENGNIAVEESVKAEPVVTTNFTETVRVVPAISEVTVSSEPKEELVDLVVEAVADEGVVVEKPVADVVESLEPVRVDTVLEKTLETSTVEEVAVSEDVSNVDVSKKNERIAEVVAPESGLTVDEPAKDVTPIFAETILPKDEIAEIVKADSALEPLIASPILENEPVSIAVEIKPEQSLFVDTPATVEKVQELEVNKETVVEKSANFELSKNEPEASVIVEKVEEKRSVEDVKEVATVKEVEKPAVKVVEAPVYKKDGISLVRNVEKPKTETKKIAVEPPVFTKGNTFRVEQIKNSPPAGIRLVRTEKKNNEPTITTRESSRTFESREVRKSPEIKQEALRFTETVKAKDVAFKTEISTKPRAGNISLSDVLSKEKMPTPAVFSMKGITLRRVA